MAADLLIRYLHFVSIIAMFAAVVAQHLALRPSLSRRDLGRIQKMDLVYAIAVVVVLLTGFAQWLWVAKPAEFYSRNPVFHVKLTLFLVVGLVSIYPSVFFGKQRKGDPSEMVAVPKGIAWSVRIELFLLLLMPLLASMMARGIGISVENAP